MYFLFGVSSLHSSVYLCQSRFLLVPTDFKLLLATCTKAGLRKIQYGKHIITKYDTTEANVDAFVEYRLSLVIGLCISEKMNHLTP